MINRYFDTIAINLLNFEEKMQVLGCTSDLPNNKWHLDIAITLCSFE